MTTIFTTTFNLDDTGNVGFSIRQVCTITGNAQGQVRVTFNAASAGSAAGGLQLDHASIGIQTGANDATTAVPVELLFSGAHGFTIADGASIVSDWANLAGFTSANKLIVVMDCNSVHAQGMAENSASTGQTFWFQAATASYNVAAPGFASSVANIVECVSLIETQAAGGGGAAIAKVNFKLDKFKTPSRSMGPNSGLFQVRAFPIATTQPDTAGQVIFRVRNQPWRW